MKPGKNFDKPDLYDLSGLYIRTNSGCVLAQAIDKDSVADKAGMKEGDILTRLDGQDIAKIELFDVRKRLCEDGTRVKLRVKQAEKELEFTLDLKSFETKK
ncbi:PDZ domain-containing protein [Telmatocola sphagniphila]|uniref:PDZ domain-containing protein n=1 Tax=Telmatocola sphagniphila TaxID=1123043 RepID=A0A8E6B429_9BACT|nr:PDZ domain-containing protein [Telmatocola sphagniphila]QVL31800.1 PDZ domain-containing protein [Telmatocola sphagniphila]